MAYEIMFLEKKPAFVLTTREKIWENTTVQASMQVEIDTYLGNHTKWEFGATRIGFGGCGIIKTKGELVRLTFLLSQESLRHMLLTISFLLDKLSLFQDRNARLLTVENLCREEYHPLSGHVSAGFRRRLKSITTKDKKLIVKNMRRAFVSVVPQKIVRYSSDCFVSIDGVGERFILGCFGDCDIAIYGDQYAEPGNGIDFSSHNLDAAYQQATLLAGLATLYDCIKKKII